MGEEEERRSARERERGVAVATERKERERERERGSGRSPRPRKRKKETLESFFVFRFFHFFFYINVMSTIAKFFVDKHWKIAQVVLPTSMLFGFMYTMKHGEAPFDIRGSNTSVRGVSTAAKDALPLHSVSMRFNWDTNQTKD